MNWTLIIDNECRVVGESEEADLIIGAFLYEYNMNITGYVDLNGTGYLEYVEATGEYRTFMLVHGNIADLGKKIAFRIRNEVTGVEYDANGQQLNFIADGLIGTVPDPYLFFSGTTGIGDGTQEGYHLGQNQPNPTAGFTDIMFALPVTEEVRVSLYDVNGVLVGTLIQGEYQS